MRIRVNASAQVRHPQLTVVPQLRRLTLTEELDRLLARFMELVQQVQDSQARTQISRPQVSTSAERQGSEVKVCE